MDRFSEEYARNLCQLLVAEIAANARIAAALRMDSAELQLKLALESVSNTFAKRYGHPLSRNDDP